MSSSSSTATVLVVASSCKTLGDMEWPSALPAEVFAETYYELLRAGLLVDLATVSGAELSLDWSGVDAGGGRGAAGAFPPSPSPPSSSISPASRHARSLLVDPSAQELLRTPRAVAHCRGDDYDGVVVLSPTGGWDVCRNAEVARVLRECSEERGGAVGGVGWGVSALLNAGLLAPGVAATAISDKDEDANGTAAAVPFLLESRMRREGVVFTSPPPGRGGGVAAGASAARPLSPASHVVGAKGGKLVTGYDNAASAAGVARGLVQALTGGVRLLAV